MVAKVLLSLLLPQAASAWGKDGHSIIADIAQGLLTDKARSRALKLLGKQGNLSDVANWADREVHTDEFHWTEPLHFTNVKDDACWHGDEKGYMNCTFNYERDCVDRDGNNPGFCNAGAIANFSNILRDGLARSDSGNDTVNALKFVVHFIGDIHQPLHCGLLRDRGGVQMNVFYPVNDQGSHWNLHNVWDFGLIVNHEGHEGNRAPMVKGIQKMLSSDWKSKSAEWTAQMDPKVWVQEALDMATQFAYRFPNGTAIHHSHGKHDEVHLQPALQPYIQEGGIIDRQLATGGVRLAAVLNDIFDGHSDEAERIVVV